MLAERLRRWVEALCAPACAGRAAGSAEGAAARTLIAAALRDLGLAPESQPVPPIGGANVFARLGGAEPLVLVGAHHDHLGRTPDAGAFWGADDNAAAVALLLELGRTLAVARPDR